MLAPDAGVARGELAERAQHAEQRRQMNARRAVRGAKAQNEFRPAIHTALDPSSRRHGPGLSACDRHRPQFTACMRAGGGRNSRSWRTTGWLGWTLAACARSRPRRSGAPARCVWTRAKCPTSNFHDSVVAFHGDYLGRWTFLERLPIPSLRFLHGAKIQCCMPHRRWRPRTTLVSCEQRKRGGVVVHCATGSPCPRTPRHGARSRAGNGAAYHDFRGM